MRDLISRLWESDSASALTNEAARHIEKLETRAEEVELQWQQLEYAHRAISKALERKDFLLSDYNAQSEMVALNGSPTEAARVERDFRALKDLLNSLDSAFAIESPVTANKTGKSDD